MVVSIKRKIKDSFLSAGNSGNNMPDVGWEKLTTDKTV